MSTISPNSAIFFEPDGYLLSGPKLMGRQAAGNAFLRATVAGRGDAPLFVYTPHKRSAEIFSQMVKGFDSRAIVQWIPSHRLDMLRSVGALFLPGPGIDAAAYLRLREGVLAYSLVGVTHTTASHGAMDSIAGLLSAPVMPWDALICTSQAVGKTVISILEAHSAYLNWRFGHSLPLTLPQLPVIPLGVHCDDFAFSAEERSIARKKLRIDPDEVVVLYVGRLSFHAKAHPHVMYLGLQRVVERTGKKVTLIQCGWFANESIEKSFVDGAAEFCQDVRAIYIDGREAGCRRQSWAAADIFVSLSDNIQETFGLTPIEAMAASLPVVVTDWNGYKETVRDGQDGFRIPTQMAPPDLGEPLARAHEAGVENYDFYCGLTCQSVAVDGIALVQRLTDLVLNRDLRIKMGASGKTRALEMFDWPVVYGQYQKLYAELSELRRRAASHPDWKDRIAAAPNVAANRMDPFKSFGHYPTALIGQGTLISAAPDASLNLYEKLAQHALFNYAAKVLPSFEVVERLLGDVGQGVLSVEALAKKTGYNLGTVVASVAILAKMGLVTLTQKEIA